MLKSPASESSLTTADSAHKLGLIRRRTRSLAHIRYVSVLTIVSRTLFGFRDSSGFTTIPCLIVWKAERQEIGYYRVMESLEADNSTRTRNHALQPSRTSNTRITDCLAIETVNRFSISCIAHSDVNRKEYNPSYPHFIKPLPSHGKSCYTGNSMLNCRRYSRRLSCSLMVLAKSL